MLFHIHSLFHSPSFNAATGKDRPSIFHANFLHFPVPGSYIFHQYSERRVIKFHIFANLAHISRNLHEKRHLSRDTLELRVKYVGGKPRKFSRVAHKSFSLLHRPTDRYSHTVHHAALPHVSIPRLFHHQRASKCEFPKLPPQCPLNSRPRNWIKFTYCSSNRKKIAVQTSANPIPRVIHIGEDASCAWYISTLFHFLRARLLFASP